MTKDDIYSITQQFNAKKGIDIFVVRIIPNVDKDDFSDLRQQAREFDGYYSNFVHGFVFNTEDDASEFGEALCEYFEADDVPEYEEEPVSVPKKSTKKKDTKKTEEKKTEAKRSGSATKPRPQVPSYDMTGIGSLKLHEAIKRILDCDGTDALKDVTIVNLLSDFQAYKDVPSSKFVLRMFISEGYVQKLMAIGKWNNQCQMLVNKFVGETGFQSSVADFVIQSVACALEWRKDINIAQLPTDNGGQASPKPATSSPQPSSTPTKPAPRASAEKWEDYLESLIEWKVDLKQKYNLDTTISIRVDDDKDFHILTTVSGKHKGINLVADIFNENNKLKVNETLLYSCDAIKGYCSKDSWIYDIKANKVGKIVIYEDS